MPSFDERATNARELARDGSTTRTKSKLLRAPRRVARPRAPKRSSGGYQLPPLNLLAASRAIDRFAPSQESIQETAAALERVLQDFGVRGEIINARPGPVVTLYELEPAPGIKSSRVIGLADDIARSMSALSARVAVVSGRNAIGIELPNERREKVYFREMLASSDYESSQAKLPLCLGKTIGGEPVVVDLARMPHLLIAGTTGSGKSVAINTMILSLLYRLTPEQCRLIMVDPKMLELSVYDHIPHLLTPVVTDPKKSRRRAQMGGARDGRALQENVQARRAQHRRLQRAACRRQGQGRRAVAHRPYRLRQGNRRGDLREGGARARAAAATSW